MIHLSLHKLFLEIEIKNDRSCNQMSYQRRQASLLPWDHDSNKGYMKEKIVKSKSWIVKRKRKKNKVDKESVARYKANDKMIYEK